MWPFKGYVFAASIMEDRVIGPFIDEREAAENAGRMSGGRVFRSRYKDKWAAFADFKRDNLAKAQQGESSQSNPPHKVSALDDEDDNWDD